MKYKVTILISTLITCLPVAAAFAQGSELAREKGCIACHDIDQKKVGPSYRDVAEKYRNDAAAIDTLITKVQAGGSGVWGQIPMPPQSRISDDDLETLVKWILSQ